MKLYDFLTTHRDEIIARARAKVSSRTAPQATAFEITSGVPLFLTQLGAILRQEDARSTPDGTQMESSATQHGADLLEHGFSISQVVHDYGDVCQAITELALELEVAVGTPDFHTLNRCLDDAIGYAVTEYARRRDVGVTGAEVKRQGFFAHELRNHLNTAMLAFQAVKSGRVGVTGSTIEVLERSLRGLRELVDRSVSEVRLASATHFKQRLRLATIIEELEIDATVDAASRGLRFSTGPVDSGLMIEVDQHLFASAVSNLLQNACKFTVPSGHVSMRIHSTADRISIEVQDECGGLPPGAAETIFRPFDQRGPNRVGLGLGLAICRQAIEVDGGKISVRDIPGKGCVFIVDMPRALGVPVEN